MKQLINQSIINSSAAEHVYALISFNTLHVPWRHNARRCYSTTHHEARWSYMRGSCPGILQARIELYEANMRYRNKRSSCRIGTSVVCVRLWCPRPVCQRTNEHTGETCYGEASYLVTKSLGSLLFLMSWSMSWSHVQYWYGVQNQRCAYSRYRRHARASNTL